MYGLDFPPNGDPEEVVFLEWLRKITKFVNSLVNVKNATTTYTVDVDTVPIKRNISYVRADATGGTFTVTLPPTVDNIGRKILIKKIDSSGNAVTVAGSGSDTIEGSATKSLAAQWSSYYLVAGASGSWEII